MMNQIYDVSSIAEAKSSWDREYVQINRVIDNSILDHIQDAPVILRARFYRFIHDLPTIVQGNATPQQKGCALSYAVFIVSKFVKIPNYKKFRNYKHSDFAGTNFESDIVKLTHNYSECLNIIDARMSFVDGEFRIRLVKKNTANFK
jgi:hypothetical protein